MDRPVRERPETIEDGADEWAVFWMNENEKTAKAQAAHIYYLEDSLDQAFAGWKASSDKWYHDAMWLNVFWFVFALIVVLIHIMR